MTGIHSIMYWKHHTLPFPSNNEKTCRMQGMLKTYYELSDKQLAVKMKKSTQCKVARMKSSKRRKVINNKTVNIEETVRDEKDGKETKTISFYKSNT